MKETQAIKFTGAIGHPVSGRLDLPDGTPRGFAIFAHCFTCSKNYKIAVNLGKTLAESGYGLLRFDFTGLGDSAGDFSQTTFSTNLGDLLAAADWLTKTHAPPIALVGHSLGGAAALAMTSELPSVRCVATIAAPSNVTHIEHLREGVTFDESGTARVSVGSREHVISQAFFDDLGQHDLEARIKSLGVPLLIFHAPGDTVVSIDHAEKIFLAAKHPKSFISLGASDHLVSDAATARMVGETLVAWLDLVLITDSEGNESDSER